MAVIDQLIVQFSADFKELSRELNKAQGETSRAMRGMENALKPIGTAFRALGAVAAAAGVSLSVGFVKNTLDAVGGIGELAEQLGTSTEMLQVYEFAAAQAGVEQGQLEAGLSKLTKTLGDAAAGEETAVKAFRALGVGVLDAKGNIRDTDTVIAEIADKIASVEDPAKRAAIVVDVFGKSGQRLLPILSQGAAGLQIYRTEAHATGAVISDSLTGKADAASDSVAKMVKSFEALTKQLVAMAAGPIKEFADAWVNALKKINENSAFDKQIKDQKSHIELLREERRLIEQIGQMKGAVGENPLPKNAAAIRKMEEQAAAIRAQINAAATPATVVPAAATGGGGGGTIPRTQAEIEKDRKDFEKREAALSERLMEIDERKTEAMLANRQAYTDAVIASGIAIADAEKAYRDRMTAEMNAVAEGVQNLAEANAKVAEENARAASDAARELGLTFTSAFEDAVVAGKKLSEVLQGLAQDLIRIMVRKTVTEPLATFGHDLLKGLNLFGKAGGGTISGPTLVGERGPEVFNPGGSGTIVPMSRMGGGASVTYNIDARGADPSVLPRLQAMLDRNKREAVAMAVNTVRSRNAREPAFLGGR
jgi:hypothetical protein